jgi:phospholipase C
VSAAALSRSFGEHVTNVQTLPASDHLRGAVEIQSQSRHNEHPGYADLTQGQQHVASLVSAVQKSSLWHDSVIIITYDENGGRWDHVVPPVRNGGWGVGTRVPAIVISPFSKGGAINGNEHETVSILKTIERRFNLAPLSSRDADSSIRDLTDTLNFNQDDQNQQ